MGESPAEYSQELSSGYIPDDFAGVDREFSAFKVLRSSGRHIIVRARRYGRLWVLKAPAPGRDSVRDRALLRKEFEIMVRLPRKGFVQVQSIEEVPGYGSCLVMEYVEGPTLREWLSAAPSAGERRQMALQMIEIVESLHALGIVSRDIKPDNFIVRALSGKLVMIDFDLADSDTDTQFKEGAGTGQYMPVEQQSDSRPDLRNDIYSLAKTLLEMRLPLIWRPALRRCLRCKERRPSSAGALRKSLRRCSLMARAALLLIALSLPAIFIIAHLFSSSGAKEPSVAKSAAVTAPREEKTAGVPTAASQADIPQPAPAAALQQTPVSTTLSSSVSEEEQRIIEREIGDWESQIKAHFRREREDFLSKTASGEEFVAYRDDEFYRRKSEYLQGLAARFGSETAQIIIQRIEDITRHEFKEQEKWMSQQYNDSDKR